MITTLNTTCTLLCMYSFTRPLMDRENNTGERALPCLRPVHSSNSSLILSCIFTLHEQYLRKRSSQNSKTYRWHPVVLKHNHNFPLSTLSYASAKSMNATIILIAVFAISICPIAPSPRPCLCIPSVGVIHLVLPHSVRLTQQHLRA